MLLRNMTLQFIVIETSALFGLLAVTLASWNTILPLAISWTADIYARILLPLPPLSAVAVCLCTPACHVLWITVMLLALSDVV